MSQEKKKSFNKVEQKEEHGPKIDTFFQKLPDDYLIKLYKYKGLKKEFIKDYINECPDNEFIREKFGPGRFAMLCYKIEQSGNQKFFDSVEMNLADLNALNPNQDKQIPNTESEEKFLQRLAIYKEIFSQNQSSPGNDINGLVQMMTLQIQATQENARLQQQQIQQFVEVQMQSMQQIQNMLLSSSKESKKSFGELLDVIDFYESIKGEKETGSGIAESLIKNPETLVNLFGMFSNQNKTETPEQQPVETISNQFPKEFLEKLTRKNQKDMTKKLFELNKNKLTENQATVIIEQLLKEKGV